MLSFFFLGEKLRVKIQPEDITKVNTWFALDLLIQVK